MSEKARDFDGATLPRCRKCGRSAYVHALKGGALYETPAFQEKAPFTLQEVNEVRFTIGMKPASYTNTTRKHDNAIKEKYGVTA